MISASTPTLYPVIQEFRDSLEEEPVYKGNQSESETLVDITNRLEREQFPIRDSDKPVIFKDGGKEIKDDKILLVERGYR